MKTRTLIWVAAVLLTLAWGPTGAQDQIPESSGFGGYFMTGGAHFSFASNMLVGHREGGDVFQTALLGTATPAPSNDDQVEPNV